MASMLGTTFKRIDNDLFEKYNFLKTKILSIMTKLIQRVRKNMTIED